MPVTTSLVRLITATAILATACSAAPQSTISKAQALARIEELVSGAVGVIRPKLQLELYEPSTNDLTCTDSRDPTAPAPVEVSRQYFLRGLPTTEDELRPVVAAVKAYWQGQGHQIRTEHRLDVHASSRPDNFLMSIQLRGDNVLSIGATSTCLWPDGTPPPPSTEP